MTTPDPLAWGAMVSYCGWDPACLVTDQTDLLDGDGSTLLLLPSLNVTAVTAVAVTDTWGTVWTPAVGFGVQAYCDVGWKTNGELIWNGIDGWSPGQQNVSVTWSGGYDGPPDDLNAAVMNLSNRLGGMGAASTKMGTAAVNFGQVISSGGLLLIEQMVFDKYRIPRVR